MTGKQLLHRDVELCKWWVGVSHDPRFDQFMLYVKSELADISQSWESLKGASSALNLMQTITDNAEDSAVFPTSGLDTRPLDQIANRPTLTPVAPAKS